jgi:hypothetical protein
MGYPAGEPEEVCVLKGTKLALDKNASAYAGFLEVLEVSDLALQLSGPVSIQKG